MSGTTFPLITAGWRAAVGWYPETNYGFAPLTTLNQAPNHANAYNWVGAVQEIHATIDKQPILVYRMDGQTDYPAYILRGQRNVELTVTYWPQVIPYWNAGGSTWALYGDGRDLGILNDMITNIGTSNAVSHSFIIRNYDTGTVYTVTGAMANTVTLNGKNNGALEVVVDYWCQNIMRVLPSGFTSSNFPSDPGTDNLGVATPANAIPFYFTQEDVEFPTGTAKPQTLTFTGTITNNLARVYQFGQDYVRSIPTLPRKAEGSVTATFAAFNDYDTGGTTAESNIMASAEANGPPTTYTDPETDPSGLTGQNITLRLGNANSHNYTLTFNTAKLPKIDLDSRISDLVALQLNWTAQGATLA